MVETARSRAVSGSSGNGRTATRARLANHHPGVSLIAQQRETGHAIVVGGSWVRAGTSRYLLSRHRYTTLLRSATYRVGMAPISQYDFLIARLTRGECSGMRPFSPQHRRSSGFGGLCPPSNVGVLQHPGRAGVDCSNWGWGNGSQLGHLGLPDARTHEPACPAAHLVCSMWSETSLTHDAAGPGGQTGWPMSIRYCHPAPTGSAQDLLYPTAAIKAQR